MTLTRGPLVETDLKKKEGLSLIRLNRSVSSRCWRLAGDSAVVVAMVVVVVPRRGSSLRCKLKKSDGNETIATNL